jgi:ribosomal protein L7/L12
MKGGKPMSYLDHEIFEIKKRMTKLENQIAFIMEYFELEFTEGPDQGVSPKIMHLVRKGEKMKAIKLYREKTGAGLKEAKEFIESLKL